MFPLQIKLGIVKNFIKAIVRQPKILDCSTNIFPEISQAKLKEGVLNGPDIRKLMKSKEFKDALVGYDYLAWRAVNKVIRHFWELSVHTITPLLWPRWCNTLRKLE